MNPSTRRAVIVCIESFVAVKTRKNGQSQVLLSSDRIISTPCDNNVKMKMETHQKVQQLDHGPFPVLSAELRRFSACVLEATSRLLPGKIK